MIDEIRSFISFWESKSGSVANKPPLIVAKKNDARFASPITMYSFSSEMLLRDESPVSAAPVVACNPMAAEIAIRVPVYDGPRPTTIASGAPCSRMIPSSAAKMVRNFVDHSANHARKILPPLTSAIEPRRVERSNPSNFMPRKRVDSTLIFRYDLKPDPTSLRRNRVAKSIGPLDHTHAIAEDSLVKSDRPQGRQIFDSIKIEMING